MNFSNPGTIGVVTGATHLIHGATHRKNPHRIACINEPKSPWVNVLYPIAGQEHHSFPYKMLFLSISYSCLPY